MSIFCTECGAPSTGASFCTSCGAAANRNPVESLTSSPQASSVMLDSQVEGDHVKESSSTSAGTGRKKKVLLTVGLAVLLVGGGLGSFFAGRQSIDLEKERDISYNLGITEGQRAGDSAGYRRGLDEGKASGCREVFSFGDGIFDYLVPYDPYSTYNRYPGSQYTSRSSC